MFEAENEIYFFVSDFNTITLLSLRINYFIHLFIPKFFPLSVHCLMPSKGCIEYKE